MQTAALPSGGLRIDVPGRIGRLIVAPALPAFLDSYPGIDIELGFTDRVVNMVEDSVDCVAARRTADRSGLIARFVGRLHLIDVASPAHLTRSAHHAQRCALQ